MKILRDNKIKFCISVILLFCFIGCKKDLTGPTKNNSSTNYDGFGYISGWVKSSNWEINGTNLLGIWSEETMKTPNSSVYHIRFDSKKSPIKSPLDSKREFEFELKLTDIEKNSTYNLLNTSDGSNETHDNWMSFSFKSLIPELKFTSVYTINSKGIILKIDKIQKDLQSKVPIVTGSIKGSLINKDNIHDSIFMDLKFKSTSRIFK